MIKPSFQLTIDVVQNVIKHLFPLWVTAYFGHSSSGPVWHISVKLLKETVKLLSLAFHNSNCVADSCTIKLDVHYLVLQHSKESIVSLKMSSYAMMRKDVDAFVSHRSYPVTIVGVSLSQLSGLSVITWNEHANLIGICLLSATANLSSISWALLWANIPSPSAVLKKVLLWGMHFAECVRTRFDLCA